MSEAGREWLETCVEVFTPATTPTPTTAPPTPTPTPTRTPAPTTPPPPVTEFPTPASTGVPAGWVPVSTRTSTLRVTTAGSVVQDIRILGGDLVIAANNVTVRRVELQGGQIDTGCRAGTVIEDTSILRQPGPGTTGPNDPPAIGPGNYTLRRVEVDGQSEGPRAGCGGPVTMIDSFARAVRPDVCGDWHGDAFQGYDGARVDITNSTLELVEGGGCGGTAAFFYPRGSLQGNRGPVHINRLLVKGGGFPFRLGHAGTVTGLRIATSPGSVWYGPIDVRCSVLTAWEAQVVTIDSNYRITSSRPQSCNTESGF